jgi:hypothetical protein
MMDSGHDILPDTVVCRQSDQVFCNPSTGLCTSLGAAGASCDNRGSDCASHSCDGQTCRPEVGIGESCGTAACGPDAYCDSSSTCAARLPPGSPCISDKQCTENGCVAGVCTPLTPVQMNMLGAYGCILPTRF